MIITKKNFIEDINLMRGWAIFLVVVGHISLMENVPAYQAMRGMIVRFHMPLFMIISGYLFSRSSRKKITSVQKYGDFVFRKTKRLVPAYIFTTLLIFLIKSLAGQFVVLATPITLYTVKMMFIYPMEGFVVYLWFIYTLYIIFMLYPITELVLSKINIFVRTLFYFALVLIPMPQFMCLNLVFKYLIFFHLGGLVFYGAYEKPQRVNGLLFLFLCVFLAGHISINYIPQAGLWLETTFILTALSGIIASYLFVQKVKDAKNALYRLFNFIGLYAFEIYLFHSLGTESTAYILKSILPGGIVFTSVLIPTSAILGLCVPILFVRLLKRYCPNINNLIFGNF